MYLNFLLREMTHLRYYVPIIEEGNRRGIKSRFLITPSRKYNCPLKHHSVCEDIMNRYNIEAYDGKKKVEGVLFINENSGLEYTKNVMSENCKLVVTTYQTDFTESYSKYYDEADYIMMPSKNIANYYNLHNDKNLYLGITKYDEPIDKQSVYEKYTNIDKKKKKVLLMWPKYRDLHKFPIDIIRNFNELGWQVLVKTRGKDPVSKETTRDLEDNGNCVFYDNWYPHTTQELLEISDLVVNCGSTTIEECVMHEVPIINFDIKPEIRHGQVKKHRVTHSYLYDYDFCLDLKALDTSFSTQKLKEMIDGIFSKDLITAFKKCKKEWLYDHKNTCKHLLDVILS